jgi:hypothetical protein
LRSLPDQDQRFGIAQSLSEGVDVLDVIVPDRDVVPGQLAEAIEGAQRVEIIVKDGNLHDALPASSRLDLFPCAYFTPSSSTSNISVAFGGITPPAPRAP